MYYTVASSSGSARKRSLTSGAVQKNSNSRDGAKSDYIEPKIYHNKSDNKGGSGYESESITSLAMSTKILIVKDVSKLPLQLRHGTDTSLKKHIIATGLWDSDMEQKINNVVQNGECRSIFQPEPHYKVAFRPLSLDSEANFSIDTIHVAEKNYLHSIDKYTSWSKAGYTCRKQWMYKWRFLEGFNISGMDHKNP